MLGVVGRLELERRVLDLEVRGEAPVEGVEGLVDAHVAEHVALDDDVTVMPARPLIDPTIHAPAAPAPKRRHPWRIAIAILVVLGLLGGAFLAWRTSQPPTAPVPS